MANWKRGRTAIIGVGAATLLALGVTPASAHYVYQTGFTYESSNGTQCVLGYAESSHGKSGDGYMKGWVLAAKDWTSGSGSHATHYNCDQNIGPSGSRWYRPSNNIAVRDYYFRLNSNPTHNKAFPQDWSVCEYSDWFYNQKSDYELIIAGEMRGPTICGDSYYGTLSVGDVNNGGWLGGSVWSGGHKLPASPSTAVDPNSTGDVGNVNNVYANLDTTLAGTTDGELSTDGLINPTLGAVTVAGPDGNPMINPATGQPFLVDLNAMSIPPTNIPGNAAEVATDLTGDPITVITHLPTGTDAGPTIAPLDLGQEMYIVPTHVAAEAITGAP